MKKIPLLFLLSCALFKPQEGTSPEGKGRHAIQCQIHESINFASENQNLNRTFKKYAQLKADYSFIDMTTAWLLAQLNNRPDLVSPNSAIQFFIRYQGQVHFHSFIPQTDQSLSYLQALEFINNTYKATKNLKIIAKDLEHTYPGFFSVSQNFAKYLEQHQRELITIPIFKKAFIRGTQTIHHLDKIPPLPLYKIVNSYLKKRKEIKNHSALISLENGPQQLVKCNKTINPYPIVTTRPSYYPIAIFDNQGNAIIAAITQNRTKIQSWNDTFIFASAGTSPNAFFCLHVNKTTQLHTLVFSINSYSPAQVMEQFLSEIKKKNALNHAIEKARTLKMKNPSRIIYEYNRGSENQYQKLLDKNIPIYGIDALGTIWAYTFNNQNFNLIQDPRMPSFQSCIGETKAKNEIPID